MPAKSVSLMAALVFAAAAVAQDKPKPPSAPPPPAATAAQPAATAASTTAVQPAGDQMPEAPDGTKMPVVQRSKITVTMDMEDLKVGTGPDCPAGATITINYHGTVAGGGLIATTRDKKPETLQMVRLIPGWQFGVQGMKVGGVRVLHIPHQLAWGDRDVPGQDGKILIPAKSDVVFSIELLAINGKDANGDPYPPKEKAISREEKPDGLIIEEIKIGEGAECPADATVVMHYRGSLASDGTVFQSSYDSGKPIEMPLSNFIKGWQEGIPGMKVGGKRRLTIPAELAYGANPRPGSGIPPNAMLVFDIELIDFKK